MRRSSAALRSCTPPGSYSISVTAAVEPGTKTDARPFSTPACEITLCTPSVRSITSPSPSVEKRRCAVWTGTVALQASAAGERLPGLVEQRLHPLDLVRRHRVAVLGLRVAALAHVLGKSTHALDHLLLDVGVALHEAPHPAVVDAEQVVKHQHLAVGGRTGADPDHGHLEPRHDGRGEVAGDRLEDDRKAPRLLEG